MTTLPLVSCVVKRMSHFKDYLDGCDLVADLENIKKVLQDLQTEEKNSGVEDFKGLVRALAYEIEDAVESSVLRSSSSSKSRSSKGRSGCLFGPLEKKAKNILTDYNFPKGSHDNVPGGSAMTEPQRVDHIEDPGPTVVGEQNYKEQLMKYLLGPESKLSVIAICGIGGIGKTNLAQSVYTMVGDFFVRAWVLVADSQSLGILENIIRLRSDLTRDKIAEMGSMMLMDKLYKILCGKRYLLVLDDVWSTETWDAIKIAFPDNNNGSRIIITTRTMKVAQYAATFILEMAPLDVDQSWRFLLIKSGLQNENDPGNQLNPEMINITKKVARSCEGVPLVLTVVGGLLFGKDLENWKMMLHKLDRGEFFKSSMTTMESSFKHLPSHLKPCFLCLGYFPDDQVIPVEKLQLLWMAEGLISEGMQVAEKYLSELFDRCLLLKLEQEDLFNSVVCLVHELIRDFCISKGKEEEFCAVNDFRRGDDVSSSIPRLVVHLNKLNDTGDASFNIPEAKRIRSLLFSDTVQSKQKPAWPREFSNITEFQRTRVLDFDGVDFEVKKLPKGIETLVYLRYLSFRGCYLKEFPSSFTNFPFLETLDLRVIVSCIMAIPNVLKMFLRLRHLYFPLAFRCSDGKLKLDSLSGLEVLENFCADSCDTNDLLKLQNLQILTVTVDGDNRDLTNIIDSIKKMKHNRHSSLVVKSFDCYSQERRSILEQLLGCPNLAALDIEGNLRTLPPGIDFDSSKFTKIVLNGSEFTDDPMPLFGKIPNLETLVLCDDAYLGDRLVSCKSGFPQLKSLTLETLQYLENWEVEEGSMPRLTFLTVKQCDKLKMLPPIFSKSTFLKKLKIGSMPKTFEDQVREMFDKREPSMSLVFHDS